MKWHRNYFQKNIANSVIFSWFSIYKVFGEIHRNWTLLKKLTYLARRRRRKMGIFHSKNDFRLLSEGNLEIFSEKLRNFQILYIRFLNFQNPYIRNLIYVYTKKRWFQKLQTKLVYKGAASKFAPSRFLSGKCFSEN